MQSVLTFVAWLEGTSLALWVGESDFGYPLLLAVHIIGLATFAGLLTVISLRLLGALAPIPLSGLRGAIRLAWAGLVINAISGVMLFSSQATVFVSNKPFLVKLAMIVVTALAAATIHRRLNRDLAPADSVGAMRVPAIVVLTAIASAIVAGRLIAYF